MHPRNQSCPCGSGLKYKKCCLIAENRQTQEQIIHKRLALEARFREYEEALLKKELQKNAQPLEEVDAVFDALAKSGLCRLTILPRYLRKLPTFH